MSTRKNSTDKAPKAKKVKEPKAKKPKKGKKGSADEAAISFEKTSFDAPKAAPKPKRKSPKAPKDVYTLVLLLSFLFFVAATVLLYMDLASYK